MEDENQEYKEYFLENYGHLLAQPRLRRGLNNLAKRIGWRKIYRLYELIEDLFGPYSSETRLVEYDPFKNFLVDRSLDLVSAESDPDIRRYVETFAEAVAEVFDEEGIEIVDYNILVREATPEESDIAFSTKYRHKPLGPFYYHETRYQLERPENWEI